MYSSGINRDLRRTDQYLLPVTKTLLSEGKYDIYPSFIIGDNLIFTGFESLLEKIKGHNLLIIDGYIGVFFDLIQCQLNEILGNQGFSVNWFKTSDYFKSEEAITEMIAPFTGGDDPLFGTRTSLKLEDFFVAESPHSVKPENNSDINIIIGPGASLFSHSGILIYIDVPKNEIQFRSRAGSVSNLGAARSSDPKSMYKRFYFVDWVVLNEHKKQILPHLDIFIDGQRPDLPVWMEGKTLRESLAVMSKNVLRARPWFEPGAWGGTWIRDNIPGLNKDVPNYAWSYELITPENGLLIQSSSLLCEVSFDSLMYLHADSVLGDCHQRFGTDFPIRFDFLDTFDGGNLSLQCHPRPEFMKENFGEDFTQEETYYILDSKNNANVYLGFCENISNDRFRKALAESFDRNEEFEADNYVLCHPVKKHDLLLIPYGTVHGSGKDNLVLEISTTPYIFTFKMYDWLRPDLDGKPRPLNIDRGMENLFFDRKGSFVRDKLISTPELLDSGPDWRLFHLPTHETHLYDIHRYHFQSTIEIETKNKFFVMSLVEGGSIDVITSSGFVRRFNYAETFVVSAAAKSIKIQNISTTEAILIKAFMK